MSFVSHQEKFEDIWRGRRRYGFTDEKIFSKEEKAIIKNMESPIVRYDTRHTNTTYKKQLDKSSTPQVVFKIISNQCGKSQVRNTIDYISKETEQENLDIETWDGSQLRNKSEREAKIKEWSKNFVSPESYKNQEWKLERLEKFKLEKESLEQKEFLDTADQKRLLELKDQIKKKYYIDKSGAKKSLKMRGVKDTTHMMFSVGGKDANVDHAKEAMRNFLQDNFLGRGYKYMFVAHEETNNLHFHVIVHNRSMFEKEKRLHFSKSDLLLLRSELARNLSSYGIERVATLRKDRHKEIEKIITGDEILQEKNSWYQQQMIKGGSEGRNSYILKGSIARQTQNLISEVKEYRKKYGKNSREVEEIYKNLKKAKSRIKDIKEIDLNVSGIACFKELSNIDSGSDFSKRISERINAMQFTPLQKSVSTSFKKLEFKDIFLEKRKKELQNSYEKTKKLLLKSEQKPRMLLKSEKLKLKSYNRGINKEFQQEKTKGIELER